jgi:hypothetical protein
MRTTKTIKTYLELLSNFKIVVPKQNGKITETEKERRNLPQKNNSS